MNQKSSTIYEQLSLKLEYTQNKRCVSLIAYWRIQAKAEEVQGIVRMVQMLPCHIQSRFSECDFILIQQHFTSYRKRYVCFVLCHDQNIWSCYAFSHWTFLICYADFIEWSYFQTRARWNAELLSVTISILKITLLITPSHYANPFQTCSNHINANTCGGFDIW